MLDVVGTLLMSLKIIEFGRSNLLNFLLLFTGACNLGLRLHPDSKTFAIRNERSSAMSTTASAF